jgi:putative PIN family toxin of toxin-antitoxin system
MLEQLRAFSQTVAAPPLPQPVCRDPNDDVVLACARAASADLVVSGDDDLLALQFFEGIPIVSVAQAVAILQAR